MFRTKLDVDKHVQEVFRKLRNENERNLRSYNIAKLYYGVGAYEIARRYVSSYLSVRDNSPEGHKLLAQIYEKLGVKQRALAELKSSLELDSKQPELVLRVCELLVEMEMPIDKEGARYWCERAETLYPHHPIVFKLKEHLYAAHGKNDSAELEALIAAELTSRPKDVNLRIRLLKLYLDTGRVVSAYEQAVDVESQYMFVNEQVWYDCLVNILQVYQGSADAVKDWQFHMHYVWALERSVWLYLQEQLPGSRMQLVDCVQALFRFDQELEEATQQVAPPSERELYKQYLGHMRAQLCLHLATFIFKRTSKELGNWKDACSMAAPLLLQAMVPPLDLHSMWLHTLPEVRKKAAERWNLEAAFRCSQAGHVILSMTTDNVSRFLEKVNQFCSGNWRERIFKRIFLSRDHQQTISTSHFMKHASFASVPSQVPTRTLLRPYDERSQKLQPAGLHYLVWLGLQDPSHGRKGAVLRPGPDFCCHIFDKLQLTCTNLNDTSPATLNKLDVDAFLYAAVFCSGSILEEQQATGLYSSDRPVILPASIMPQLCSAEQAKWWSTAYKLYTQEIFSGDSRQVVKRGIEAIRVSGNHGLDKRLIVQLARIFADRATCLSAQTDGSADVSTIEGRASLYWNAALPMLERLQRNQSVRAPYCSLFEYRGKELSAAEVNTLVEEGRLFLACRLMKQDRLEESLEAFQQLKSPYATFHQASIYRRLAAEELNGCRPDEITSEMRSRHIMLLVKARDALYLTYDRLRSPGTDPKHPLNAQLSALIHDVESELGRIDPEMSNDVRNELDGYSEESGPSLPSVAENLNIFQGSPANWQNSSSFAHITPRTRYSFGRYGSVQHRSAANRLDDADMVTDHIQYRTEARPSPERLDAQIRHMLHSRDTVVQNVLEKTKMVIESNETILQQLKENTRCMEDLKREVLEVKKEIQDLKRDMKTRKSASSSHLNADLGQVENDEGLYMFDEDDYADDMVGGRQYRSFHTPHPTYPVMFPPTEAQPPMISTFFPRMDPHLVYPAPPLSNPGGYYNTSALPFSEGQQLPDFRGGPPPAPPAFVQPKPVPTAPVNVVITSSDTLPTSVPAVQPTLSVTIPPQHRSSSATSVPAPHAFQISLPTQAPPPPPSVLTKEAVIAISKDKLLSSVPSPTYSAVSPGKADKEYRQRKQSESEDDEEEQEEHDPSFEPVIPLPAEVELTTGEEGETVIFQNRAKLFRFVEKEWKERGVGQLKLLLNSVTKKGRVLMRREQVLKVCANHHITPDIQLAAMNDRAWVWAANDFADEEVRLEKLCARFKTAEEARKFKIAFDKIKGMVVVTPVKSSEDRSSALKMPVSKVDNSGTESKSDVTHPLGSETTSTSKPILTPAKFTFGGFNFTSAPNFKSENKTDDSKNSSKANQTSTESEKKNPMSGFTFFSTSKTATIHGAAFPSSDENKMVSAGSDTGGMESKVTSSSPMFTVPETGLSFSSLAQQVGDSNQFGFKKDNSVPGWPGMSVPVFGGSTPAKDDDRVEDFVPTAEFQPVVPLPELVEVKTGEEEQETLYQQRAKLLRFDSEAKQWKERGIGQMKVLRDPTTGRIRLLMRREQVLKVCCNHFVTKEMKFNSLSTSDRAWTWYAQDYSDGELQAELLAIKFKTAEQAQDFKVVIDRVQSEMESADIYEPFDESFDTALGINLQQYGTTKQLSVWTCECLFPNSENSKQCRSCKKKKPPQHKDDKFPSFSNSQGKLSEICKPKEGSWDCNTCYINNDAERLQCIACSANKPEKKNPSDDNKLADLLKAKNASWSCGSCSSLNDAGKDKCVACGCSKQIAATNKPTETVEPLWEMFKPAPDTWECNICLVRNKNSAEACVSCGASNPSVPPTDGSQQTQKQSPFTFGVSSQSSGFNLQSFSTSQASTTSSTQFTFGVQPEVKASSSAPLPSFSSITSLGSDTSSDKPFMFGTRTELPSFQFGISDAEKLVPDSSFTFGSEGKFNFNFSGVRPKSPTKSPKSPGGVTGVSAGEEESDVEAEDEGEHIYFQPVIPLPDKVPLVTGEEDETVVYCHRAKLYRFVDGEWKDRGVGDFKVLRHKITEKVRLVMRRDQVLKLCANHYLTPELKFALKDEKSWMWCAPDFSEGHVTNEKFALRFKNKEIAEEFGDIIRKTQAGIVDQSGSTPVKPSKPTDAAGNGSVVRSLFGNSSKETPPTSSDDDEVQFVGEVQATADEQQEARRLMLPPNFYLYRRQASCPGCRGCEPDSDREGTSEKLAEDSSSSTAYKSLPSKSSGAVFNNTTVSTVTSTTTFTTAFGTPASSQTLFSGTPSETLSKVSSTSSVASSTDLVSRMSCFNSSCQTSGSSGVQLQSAVGNAPQPTSVFGNTSNFVFGGAAKPQASASPVFGAVAQPVAATTTSHIFGGSTSVSVSLNTNTTSTTTTPVVSTSTLLFSTGTTTSTSVPVNIFGGAAAGQKPADKSTTLPAFSIPVLSSANNEKQPSDKPVFSITVLNQNNTAFPTSAPQQSESQLSNSPFSVQAPDSSTVDAAGSNESKDVFPTDANLTFASLAKSQAGSFTSVRQQNFMWEGAGAKVFGGPAAVGERKKAVTEEGSGDEDDGEDAAAPHDPQFEPIIALPDAIEVRTGEEEEEKVFGERGKLYRYETGTKEWKERGVGEMKILWHPVNNTYRLLLRREQVYKVVCNHLITADLELKHMNFTEKALCWGALNYADEAEPQLEKLAIRFKSMEIGKVFKEKFEQCRAKVQKLQLSKSEVSVQDSAKERLSYERRPTLPSDSVLHQDGRSNDGNDDAEDGEEEEEDDDDDDEDDDDDDEYDDFESGVLFEKEGVLLLRKDSGQSVEMGMTHVTVVFDEGHHLGHIYAHHEDSGHSVSDVYIDNTCALRVDGSVCEWTGIDACAGDSHRITLSADMVDTCDAEDFKSAVMQCRLIVQNRDEYNVSDPDSI